MVTLSAFNLNPDLHEFGGCIAYTSVITCVQRVYLCWVNTSWDILVGLRCGSYELGYPQLGWSFHLASGQSWYVSKWLKNPTTLKRGMAIQKESSTNNPYISIQPKPTRKLISGLGHVSLEFCPDWSAGYPRLSRPMPVKSSIMLLQWYV